MQSLRAPEATTWTPPRLYPTLLRSLERRLHRLCLLPGHCGYRYVFPVCPSFPLAQSWGQQRQLQQQQQQQQQQRRRRWGQLQLRWHPRPAGALLPQGRGCSSPSGRSLPWRPLLVPRASSSRPHLSCWTQPEESPWPGATARPRPGTQGVLRPARDSDRHVALLLSATFKTCGLRRGHAKSNRCLAGLRTGHAAKGVQTTTLWGGWHIYLGANCLAAPYVRSEVQCLACPPPLPFAILLRIEESFTHQPPLHRVKSKGNESRRDTGCKSTGRRTGLPTA